MSSSKKSNGRSPLVNQQSQITAFFSKKPPGSSPSPSESPSPAVSKVNPNPNGSPGLSPSPITPSPLQSKRKKTLLVISPNIGASSAEKPSSEKKSYGAEVVDRRVKVYWPLDKSWYEGVVKSFDVVSGKHVVQYDDAEEEKLNLSVEKIEWIEEPAKKKLRRLRRFSVLEEDDDGEDEVDLKELEVEDDSDDEDWEGKVGNGILEDEECLDDLDLEVEEEEIGKASVRKNTSSRKRKVGEGEGVASKKGKNGGESKNSVSKLSSSGSAEKLIVPISGTSAFSAKVSLLDSPLVGDTTERFAKRNSEKFRFLES